MINGRWWGVEYLDAEDGYPVTKLSVAIFVITFIITIVLQFLLSAIESAMSTAMSAIHNVDVSQATKIFKSLRLLSWVVPWLLLFVAMIAAIASRRY